MKNAGILNEAWSDIKDHIYGKKGTARGDKPERGAEIFKIGLLLKDAREAKNLTQDELAQMTKKEHTSQVWKMMEVTLL
jgi:hypothetical protein